MHELSVAMSIVQMAQEEGERLGGRVCAVHLKLTKVDLAAAAEFSWPLAERNIQSVRPGMQTLSTSAKSGEGMVEYIAFLEARLAEMRATTS